MALFAKEFELGQSNAIEIGGNLQTCQSPNFARVSVHRGDALARLNGPQFDESIGRSQLVTFGYKMQAKDRALMTFQSLQTTVVGQTPQLDGAVRRS